MKVGYFKVESSAPVIVSPGDRDLSLPPDRKLATRPLNKWKLITLPLTGFVLALMLVGSLQVGVKLANYDLPEERYASVAKIDLPDNVLFMASVYESVSNLFKTVVSWLENFWNYLVITWRGIWGQEEPSSLVITKTLQGGSSPVSLFGGSVSSDKKVYAVMALPSNGALEIDENLKKDLQQVFADPVDIKFDATGRSGTVTPIFPSGQRGSSYVFVLTPAR
ncbi:MAG: hypothetical protein WCV68_01350 [Candidatus Paceibacterota bacterium]|jgi:hypothetical protein